jgi:hypothetical protein
MPETYKSFGTVLGTTAATIIYNGLCSGTAIVNSVNLSNVNSGGGVLVTLEAVKGATGFSLITNASVPTSTTLQALDAPIVLEANNFLRATAGFTGYIHAFVSVLEIT